MKTVVFLQKLFRLYDIFSLHSKLSTTSCEAPSIRFSPTLSADYTKSRLESKLTEAENAIVATEEEGELALISATIKELQKQLSILEAQHQAGR